MNAWFGKRFGLYDDRIDDPERYRGAAAGLQFWRMSSTWIGGMGVVMFVSCWIPPLGAQQDDAVERRFFDLGQGYYRYRTQIIAQILLVV